VLLSLLLLALSSSVAKFLSIQSSWAIIWASIAVAPALLFPVLMGMFQGTRSFILLGVFTAFASAAKLGVGVVVVLVGLGAAGAVAAHPISALMAVVLGLVGWRWVIPGKVADHEAAIGVRLPVADQFKVAATTVVQVILFNLDILFVKALFEETIAADYSAALLSRTHDLLCREPHRDGPAPQCYTQRDPA